MGARDLLAELAGAGVTVRLDGERLIASPREMLTDDLRASLKAHKAALIVELQGGAADPACAPLADIGLQPDGRPEPPESWPDDEASPEDAEPPRERSAVWRKLIALGLDEDQADRLTAWIWIRDIEGDEHRLCIECRHFGQRGKICRHPHLIEIQAPRELGPLATTPQRCMGFAQEVPDGQH